MNTYKSEATSWGKLNVIASLIWVSFLQIAISLLAYIATFLGQLYFGRSYFFTLFQSNYFDTTTFGAAISSEQLLFSPFSEQSLFCRSYFFRIASFPGRKFSGGGSLQQLLFGTAIFSEELFFQVLLHSINLFRKAILWKKLIFQKINFRIFVLFLESCFFRATTFSKDATFYSSCLFRRATFLQHTFSEELLFHSYGSFPQSHFFLLVGNK